MKLEATKVDLKTAVDTNMFNVQGDFLWIKQKEFYTYLNSF
jgi:hypothetical protein